MITILDLFKRTLHKSIFPPALPFTLTFTVKLHLLHPLYTRLFLSLQDFLFFPSQSHLLYVPEIIYYFVQVANYLFASLHVYSFYAVYYIFHKMFTHCKTNWWLIAIMVVKKWSLNFFLSCICNSIFQKKKKDSSLTNALSWSGLWYAVMVFCLKCKTDTM